MSNALDPDLAAAIRALARDDDPYAEVLRRVRPFAAAIGVVMPSYETVRRIARAERERLRTATEEV
jgi:hypothetical protein